MTAAKALSPGIDDPTTAQHCIDRFRNCCSRSRAGTLPRRIRTRDGRMHVIVKDLPFGRAVRSAFTQILHFGASNPVIRARLIERLDALIELVPPERRPPLTGVRSAVRAHAGAEAS